MVDTLNSFAAEVTRVAKEVGTEGKLGGQADVKGVYGTWKDLTDNVNGLAANLTVQLRDVSKVATAIASGDLTQKITVDVKGEILQIKDVINKMVDQLNSFAAEVTRVAKEVGTEGKLGGQAEVKGVSGTWKDLTDNVNIMASNLTKQVRGIVKVVTAVAMGDLSQKFVLEAQGEVAALAETINNMTDTLRTFADQVTTVAREVGIEGQLGGQANVPGASGVWKDLTDNVNVMASNLTKQVRGIVKVVTAVANGDLTPEVPARGQGRGRGARRDDQQHDRHAAHVRRPGDHGGARGRHRGQARRPGQRAGRARHLARPDRQRQPARRQPHVAGARDRRGLDRRRQGRPDAVDHRRGAGRGRRAQGQHQPDDRQPEGHDAQEPGAGLAEDEPRQVLRDDAGPAQHRVGRAAHHVRAHAAGRRAARRLLHDGGLEPASRAAPHRQLRVRRAQDAGRARTS